MGIQTKLPSDIEGLASMVPPQTRRGFMTSSAAAAAGYTLLAGPVRADAIKTDANGLTVGEGKVKVAGGDMPVYFAKPANVTNPPVILVAMEIFGLHEYIKDVTRRLGHLGALAIAPDYYFRAGTDLTTMNDIQKLLPIVNAKPANATNPPVILVAMEIFGLHEYIKDVTRRLGHLGALAIAPDYYFRSGTDLTKMDDIQKLLPIVNGKPDKELYADLDATVDWAKQQGGDTGRLGIMGFCRGGRTVWLYSAHNPNLKAGVAFYGSLADPENEAWPKNALSLAGEVKAPVLGLYGAEDTGIKVDQVKDMEAKLKAAGKTAEFHIYDGAPHGFHADYRPSYREQQAKQAWGELQGWFKKYKVLS